MAYDEVTAQLVRENRELREALFMAVRGFAANRAQVAREALAADGVMAAPAASWSEVARWLHAAYDRPPQTPEVRAMLARVDAACGVPEAQQLRAAILAIAEACLYSPTRGAGMWDSNLARLIEHHARALTSGVDLPVGGQKP